MTQPEPQSVEPWEITAWVLGELDAQRADEVGAWIVADPDRMAQAQAIRRDVEWLETTLQASGRTGDQPLSLDDARLVAIHRAAREHPQSSSLSLTDAGQPTAEPDDPADQQTDEDSSPIRPWRLKSANSWNAHWAAAAALVLVASLGAVMIALNWSAINPFSTSEFRHMRGDRRLDAVPVPTLPDTPLESPRPAWPHLPRALAQRMPPAFDAQRSNWPSAPPIPIDAYRKALAGSAVPHAHPFPPRHDDSALTVLPARQDAAPLHALLELAHRRQASLPSDLFHPDHLLAGYADLVGPRSSPTDRPDDASPLDAWLVESPWNPDRDLLLIRAQGDRRGLPAPQTSANARSQLHDLPRPGWLGVVIDLRADSSMPGGLTEAVIALGRVIESLEPDQRITVITVADESSGIVLDRARAPITTPDYHRLMDALPRQVTSHAAARSLLAAQAREAAEAGMDPRIVILSEDQSVSLPWARWLEASQPGPVLGWTADVGEFTESSNSTGKLPIEVNTDGELGGRWIRTTGGESTEEAVLTLCGHPPVAALPAGIALRLALPDRLVSEQSNQATAMYELSEGKGQAGAISGRSGTWLVVLELDRVTNTTPRTYDASSSAAIKSGAIELLVQSSGHGDDPEESWQAIGAIDWPKPQAWNNIPESQRLAITAWRLGGDLEALRAQVDAEGKPAAPVVEHIELLLGASNRPTRQRLGGLLAEQLLGW
ncbi:MAG: hypothetical protein JJU36_01705 [Phycisphaeraceae bacterium]|nr:hypothetical protein [Phycisphaeraceae bacterium]